MQTAILSRPPLILFSPYFTLFYLSFFPSSALFPILARSVYRPIYVYKNGNATETAQTCSFGSLCFWKQNKFLTILTFPGSFSQSKCLNLGSKLWAGLNANTKLNPVAMNACLIKLLLLWRNNFNKNTHNFSMTFSERSNKLCLSLLKWSISKCSVSNL